ncbi:orotate phosphoribosyltransferase [Solidesulfovibrio fructosivorans JJ]]|uniref:Orotate phosphoribosyltransferase n=1 Tax=Solidesulfovibrio fructosivorans JJ] TaxID=596151 RepID=E1JVA6_SOLFR|nr:orotate phosphoribosyltransferase [Solidesulfovibrio fructosivorans]EFL51700.1 orotate phosphoribosyltransferase [Solidesulfovibrio fructosivorans JJ]]
MSFACGELDAGAMRGRLAALLLEKSYRAGEVTLTSGRKSDYYFDCKQTALYPEGAWLIGNLLFDLLPEGIVGVGGMTLGADPLVTAVSLVSHVRGRPMPAFIVRKAAKGHGTNQFLEGLSNFRPGDKVALLEDVVTTGGTLMTVIDRVQDAGLAVGAVVTVLDREEGGGERLAERGFPLLSIFTRHALLAAAGNQQGT